MVYLLIMKYRIKHTEGDSTFYIQYRKWFTWRYVRIRSGSYLIIARFSSFADAKRHIDGLLDPPSPKVYYYNYPEKLE